MAHEICSFELKADFGFFRKPDTNEGIQLSYNMLHRPALLGILGAILGLGGYRKKGEWPEYYRRLNHLRVGVAPVLAHTERGSFAKTVITYTNRVGYANADGTLIVHESTLVDPAYRVYVLLDTTNALAQELKRRLLTGQSRFVPYFGKNEFMAAWTPDSVSVSEARPATGLSGGLRLMSMFAPADVSEFRHQDILSMFSSEPDEDTFYYFERLPLDFDENLFQYRYRNLAYTNSILEQVTELPDLYEFIYNAEPHRVQLF